MWELPFWIALLCWSILPSNQTIWVEIESIPINTKDVVLLLITGFYLLPLLKNRTSKAFGKTWHHYLPVTTTLLLVYAARSIGWSGMETRNIIAMLYTLILTFSAFLLGYNLIAKMSSEYVRPFLWRLTVYLAILGLLYSAESFFSLGLRSVAFNSGDFGIDRVRGPLFGSSTGHFILIPALAFAVQEMVQERVRRFYKLAVVVALMITVLSLGSRGALLILCVFFVLVILFTKDRKQRLFLIGTITIIAAIATLLVFSRANTERLTSLEDKVRSDTYLTAFEIVKNRSEYLNIFGSGYGSYWSWYLPDVEDENAVFHLVETPYGDMLYHPHSTFLLLMVELGVPGLLYLSHIIGIFVRLLSQNLRGRPYPILNCGITASIFSIFFDFFIFKNSLINVIWWIFFIGALALPTTQADRAS
jgi:O-antigen ligase